MLAPTLLLGLSLAGGYPAADPVGERGCFELDRDPARTLGMVRAGRGSNVVTRLTTDAAGRDVYEVVIHYDMQVLLMGTMRGKLTVHVPPAYFTEGYMPWLASDEVQVDATPSYTMRHLGTKDVTTLDGVTYEGCDAIEVTEVVSETPTPVDDLVIRGCVARGAPALGNVQIDMTGRSHGLRFMAGMDLTDDQAFCPPED